MKINISLRRKLISLVLEQQIPVIVILNSAPKMDYVKLCNRVIFPYHLYIPIKFLKGFM